MGEGWMGLGLGVININKINNFKIIVNQVEIQISLFTDWDSDTNICYLSNILSTL